MLPGYLLTNINNSWAWPGVGDWLSLSHPYLVYLVRSQTRLFPLLTLDSDLESQDQSRPPQSQYLVQTHRGLFIDYKLEPGPSSSTLRQQVEENGGIFWGGILKSDITLGASGWGMQPLNSLAEV